MEERQGETDKKSTFAKKIQKGLTMVDSNNEIVVSHTSDFRSGFSQRYLAYFRKFYVTIPDVSILQTRLQNLKWSHILTTLHATPF